MMKLFLFNSLVLILWTIISFSSIMISCVDSFGFFIAISSNKKKKRITTQLSHAAAAAAGPLEVDASIEVVGGHGTIGSRFFLREEENTGAAIAVPRGVAPGCLTPSFHPIVVTVQPKDWKTVYNSTLPHRRSDLVWITKGGEEKLRSWQKNGTVVVLRLPDNNNDDEKSSSSPTLIYGKHATTIQTTLKKHQKIIKSFLEVESWANLCDLVAQEKARNKPEKSVNDDNPPPTSHTTTSVPIPAINLVCTGEPNHDHEKNVIRSAIVVGGGILGSSIARALTQRGLDNVTVFDPTPTGVATPASWAWLNANQKPPHAYSSLNQMGLRGWRSDALLSSLKSLKWSGTIVRTKEPLPSKGGYTREGPLTMERIRQLEPEANFTNDIGYFYFYADEGHVNPQEAVLALREEAKNNGASFVDGESVAGLVRDDVGRIVGVKPSSGGEPQMADVVVVAAGANSSTLAGVPLVHQNPSKTYFGDPSAAAAAPVLNRTLVDMVSSIYLAQRPDGTVVAGGGAIKFGLSASNVDRLSSEEVRQQLIMAQEVARQLAPSPVGNSPLTHAKQVVSKPMPQDGFPILGFVEPGLYSAVTHSGMTLSPLIGQLVAAEVKEQISLRILEDYRPTRFDKVTGHDTIEDWQESESKETT